MARKKKKEDGQGLKKLVLLDSHAILHRAYHAIPDFSSSKGEPTGALYGLVSMLLRVIHDLKPDYILAARDLPGRTKRHELFEAYKAKRVKAEPELVRQLLRAPEVFEAFGIPVYASPGYEADDCIGTIVKKLESESGIQVIIASGDMDTLQLVSPKVSVYTLRKGLNDTVLYDEAAVHERYGFGPEHVVDYKALRGDPSDNIPGIRGIGEKTAVELVQAFGSIEDMYRALEKNGEAFGKQVKPRVVELLKQGKKDALFSKKLASIEANVPISFKLPEKEWRLEEHKTDIATLCDEFEFRSLKSRLDVAAPKKGGERQGQASIAFTSAVQERALKETSIALWLLQSDLTNPTLDDIFHYAKTKDFDKAREHIFAELRETGRLAEVFEEIERPLIPVVEHMNAAGILIDSGYMRELEKEYVTELGKIAGRIYAHAGHEFNINSPKQLAAVLFDELKITPAKQKKTPGGARTTREDELAKLSELHPVIGDVLAYRELQKLLSTYVQKIPGLVASDGRLRTEFIQTGTTTGRMSSQNPNLQNIPIKSEYGRRIRRTFAAPEGSVFAAIDYSQIELRVAAGLSGDEKLSGVFKKGGDIHAAVAAEVFDVPPDMVDYEMRRRAKVINFGILYGMGVNALRETLGKGVTRDEASRYLSDYFKNFSGLSHWIERTKASAARRGFTETLFGRRRYFPGFQSAMPNLRAQAERMAINAPIQGTQADIIKLAMVEADKRIESEGWREKARLVLQVHDELVYELDEKDGEKIARELRRVMESVVPLPKLSGVPIVAEVAIGKNWGEVKRIGRK
ncbi:hypothetical protein C4556_01535 [Candidatus Parcubacteria bacterium]|nr:MAG: hypothetical protein C4556_01535 [Candidatus Parcubacteria bacterium]